MTCYSYSLTSGASVVPMAEDIIGLLPDSLPGLPPELAAPGSLVLSDAGSWTQGGTPVPEAEVSVRLRAVDTGTDLTAIAATDGVQLDLTPAHVGAVLRFDIAARRGGEPWSDWVGLGTRVIEDATGPLTADIVHNGATFTLTDVLSQGTHADGTPWAEVGPGGEFTQTSPASAQVVRSHETSQTDATLTTSTVWSHGMEKNPGRNWGGQSTLNGKQTVNHFGQQGLDELVLKSNFVNYTDSVNIDPGRTGTALTATPGVYVKAISKLSDLGWSARPALDALAIITIYAQGTAPATDALRPPFAGNGTEAQDVASNLDMSLLQNLPSTGFTDGVLPYATALAFAQAPLTFQYTYGVNSENVTPTSGASAFNVEPHYTVTPYKGTMMKALGDVMLMLHYDTWTTTQKRAIAAALVQKGIDVAARVLEGGVFYANGGHSHGRKFLLAFAAEMLDSAALRAACGTTVGAAQTYDGSFEGMSVFGEDDQTFYVTQADIDASQPSTSNGRSIAYAQSQLGWPEWAGERRNDTGRNTLGNTASWPYSYRDIATKGMVNFALTASLIPGMRTTMGTLSDALFDWCDRYMGYWIDGDYTVLTDATDIRNADAVNQPSTFLIDAWTQDRGTANLWAPAPAPVASVTRRGALIRESASGGSRTMNLTAMTVGSVPQNGDLVVLAVQVTSNAARSISVSTSGYTEVVAQTHLDSTSDASIRVFQKVMGASPDTSVTFSTSATSGNAVTAIAYVLNGVDTATPLDGVTPVVTTQTDTAVPTFGAITPATSGAPVLAIAGAAFGVNASQNAAMAQGDLSDAVTAQNAGSASNGASLLAGLVTASAPVAPAAPTLANVTPATSQSSWGVLLALRPA